MDIEQAMKDLGPVPADALRETILNLDENAWLANSVRQNEFEVHKQTRSVVLVFCDVAKGDLEVSKSEGWDSLADVAVPLMHDIIGRFYTPGGTIIRAMAAKLLSLALERVREERPVDAGAAQERLEAAATDTCRVER